MTRTEWIVAGAAAWFGWRAYELANRTGAPLERALVLAIENPLAAPSLLDAAYRGAPAAPTAPVAPPAAAPSTAQIWIQPTPPVSVPLPPSWSAPPVGVAPAPAPELPPGAAPDPSPPPPPPADPFELAMYPASRWGSGHF
jgi:hypothetical protein